MIFGEAILNENNINEDDFIIELCLENMMLEAILIQQDGECLTEGKLPTGAPTQQVGTKKIKYLFMKFRSKERTIQELEKDIKKCDDCIKKLEQYKKDMKDRDGKTIALGYLIDVFKGISTKHVYGSSFGYSGVTNDDFLGKDGLKKGDIKSNVDSIGADIAYSERELKHTKKYLEDKLAKLKKEQKSK